MRFGTFMAISIAFTKLGLSREEIGNFELLLFLAGAISFFWVNGLIQSLLPLYDNNKVSNHKTPDQKSPEIFNAFLLLSLFSFLAFLITFSVKDVLYVYSGKQEIPNFNLLLIYILISNPAILVEYIYLLKNRSSQIVYYAVATFFIQLFVVIAPIAYGYGIVYSLWGLIFISVVRLVWLFVLLYRFAEWKISWPYIKEHLSLGYPLIISSLLSGSSQYIDGIIVTSRYDAATFAIFRYGAKELPFVLQLANGLSNAMLKEFSDKEKLRASLKTLKKKSKRLMHSLYPFTIVILLISKWLYPRMFTEEFVRSADVFMIYLLLIICRMIFPQTIVIGMKRTKIVMLTAAGELLLNIALSVWLVNYYGLVGVALGTVIAFILEKIFLVGYVYVKLGIRPAEYIPLRIYLFYTSLLVLIFVMIDHRWILYS